MQSPTMKYVDITVTSSSMPLLFRRFCLRITQMLDGSWAKRLSVCAAAWRGSYDTINSRPCIVFSLASNASRVSTK